MTGLCGLLGQCMSDPVAMADVAVLIALWVALVVVLVRD